MRFLDFSRVLIICIFVFSLQLKAASEVTCWAGGCLKNGWTKIDISNGKFADHQCYQKGCEISGWIVGGSIPNSNVYSQCKEKGCFIDGWFLVDRQSQNLVSQVSCIKEDCLKFGWLEFSKLGNRKIECTQQDCVRHGWSASGASQDHTVQCKSGNCFDFGWFEF